MRSLLPALALLLALALLFVSCDAGGGDSEVQMYPLDLGGHTLQVEVVKDFESRKQGLMYRESLAADHGMLFIYKDARVLTFWMRDTSIELSIAFMKPDGTILKIVDLEPFELKEKSSELPCRFALEVNRGWFAEHGIAEEDIITIPESYLEDAE